MDTIVNIRSPVPNKPIIVTTFDSLTDVVTDKRLLLEGEEDEFELPEGQCIMVSKAEEG